MESHVGDGVGGLLVGNLGNIVGNLCENIKPISFVGSDCYVMTQGKILGKCTSWNHQQISKNGLQNTTLEFQVSLLETASGLQNLLYREQLQHISVK
jgi:hypothetical protein